MTIDDNMTTGNTPTLTDNTRTTNHPKIKQTPIMSLLDATTIFISSTLIGGGIVATFYVTSKIIKFILNKWLN